MTSIRHGSHGDAETLARLGTETFCDTFGRLYAESDLSTFLKKNHSVGVYRDLLGDPDWRVWLAEDAAGEAIGYAVAGPCSLPVPGLPPHSGELARLYLKKDSKGTGLGARLLDGALDFLRLRFEHVYLSVYAENAVAQRLYTSRGFVKIHDYFYMVGEHADPEWIMELTE